MPQPQQNAPGAPGSDPRWSSSAKDGIGTAYHTSSQLWFTLSHGIVNEVYFPYADTPNIRDLQFLITDGETFCHEERRDLDHLTEYPEKNALLYRITNTDRQGRYRIIKEIIGEPHSSVLLIHARLDILDPKLHGKMRLFALLAPHLKGTGQNNSAWWHSTGGRKLMRAEREDVHMVFGCSPDFAHRSVGFVGHSDGWRDVMGNFRMDWEFRQAIDGNIALTGEIDVAQDLEFTLAVSFGSNVEIASTRLLQALSTPFADQRERYVAQWQHTRSDIDMSAHTGDQAHLMRLSQCILLAHEDKTFPGAFVASLSIPWGEIKDDRDRGGYHLVWTRDMVQSATALLACGRTESALRALIWMACVQAPDGSMPQNSTITGKPYWKGMQLDEVAVPILLAWRVRRATALRQFDPWTLVSRASGYIMLNGPVTEQERWEENAGYSPSTLAAVIAALVCAAEFAGDRDDRAAADFLLVYADWLSSHLEEWTVTAQGELVKGTPRHFVRIVPAIPQRSDGADDPSTSTIQIANGGGQRDARNIVSGDFLQLVRLGVRSPHDPLVIDSIAVIDHVLKQDLPQGPCWRRYNHDGYGQKADGAAFDGTGIGRSWPILTGERGHYELAAGRDPMPYIHAMETFANPGGMLPEQLWDAADVPAKHMTFGKPTGSAMPLCWAHAEYMSLVRSARDGMCFDRIEPAYQRYVVRSAADAHDIWTACHAIRRMRHGKILRIIVNAHAAMTWTADGWVSISTVDTTPIGALHAWFVDVPTERHQLGSLIEFTFYWKERQQWEGRNFSVLMSDASLKA